ncbi:MAG: hypothetical protein OXG68_01635 [Chloroflexi bacterium]|nr:hypothetical protein [Chloroflexota bacterium]
MSATPTFYILHGDDSISRDAALARMREAMDEDGGLNRAEFDGAQASVAEVLVAVRSLPFLAEKRLVIVKGLISQVTRKGAGRAEADRLIAELPGLPVSARLVFFETEPLESGNRLLKAAQNMENGYVGYFSAPENLRDWLRMRAQAYGAEINPRAAAAISDLLSYDEHSRQARGRNAARRRAAMQARALALRAADNELHKLVCYVDGEREIGEEDVAALTPYVPQANVFEMVDALANGNGGRALELISQSLHDDPSDPGFRLFALIARQFRLLSMTRDHLDRGGGAQESTIAKSVGVQPFVAGKLATQSRRFKAAQLDAILKRLQRYDQEMKTGRIAPRLALDLLVTSLASG